MINDETYRKMLNNSECIDNPSAAKGNVRSAKADVSPFHVDLSGDIAAQIIDGLERTAEIIESNLSEIRKAVANGSFGK